MNTPNRIELLPMTDYVEILYNACFGGFGFSQEAVSEYHKRKTADPSFDAHEIERHDAVMIEIVKELGPKANGYCAKLAIERIPAHFVKHYDIVEYDGSESVQIKYDAYKIETAKLLLQDANLTKSEKISRAFAILSARLDS